MDRSTIPQKPFIYNLYNGGTSFLPDSIDGSPFHLKNLNMLHQTFVPIGKETNDQLSEFPPHWHPDADELLICLSGSVKGAIYGPNPDSSFNSANRDIVEQTFTLTKGDVILFPRGYAHFVSNASETENCEVLLTFDNAQPDIIFLKDSANYLDKINQKLEQVAL